MERWKEKEKKKDCGFNSFLIVWQNKIDFLALENKYKKL